MSNEKATVDWLRWDRLLTAFVTAFASEFKAYSAPPNSSVSMQWLGHTCFLFTDAREDPSKSVSDAGLYSQVSPT